MGLNELICSHSLLMTLVRPQFTVSSIDTKLKFHKIETTSVSEKKRID